MLKCLKLSLVLQTHDLVTNIGLMITQNVFVVYNLFCAKLNN